MHTFASDSVRRFGPYSFNLKTLELRKGETRLRIKGQPLQILVCLLEEPGRAVSREELRQKLWPGGTFVDFDHSLNTAINRLREQLRDSAENPRYIQTVSGLGYKFIGLVLDAQQETTVPNNVVTPPQPQKADSPVTTDKRRFTIFKAVASVLAVSAIAAGIAFWFFTAEQQTLTQITHEDTFATDPAVSPDGKLLVYTSDRGKEANLNIWIRQLVQGGADRQITFDDADAHEPAFSPDSSRIAYRSERAGGGVYVIPAIGGEPVLLAPEGRSPRFSPDGRWIAFWRGSLVSSLPNGYPWGAIYVVSSARGSPKRIGTELPWTGYPIWSPDSKSLLAYAERPTGQSSYDADWWVISLEGGPSVRTGIVPFLIHKGFASSGANGIPRPVQWTAKSILFTADHGDSTNVWKIDFTSTLRLISRLKRVTSSTSSDICPTIARDGSIYFSSLNRHVGIWSLSMDTERAIVRGQQQRVSSNVLPEVYASSSLDGMKLAFIRLESGRTQAWVRDLATGVQRPLGESTRWRHWSARISRDGNWVSYATDEPGGRLYVAPSAGGEPLLAAEHCAWAWDWSLDNSTLLVRKPVPDPGVYHLDLRSHTLTTFLTAGKSRITQSRYSPDDRWIIFALAANDPTGPVTESRLFLAPIKGGRPGAPDTWIAVGQKTGWDDKPSWSPEGSRIYFTSDEDGFRCIWTQVLDPETKQPLAPPLAVQHFHRARASLLNVGLAELNLAVAKDKVFYDLGELTGSIWKLSGSN